MIRRSLLGMFAAAPVAATMGPVPVAQSSNSVFVEAAKMATESWFDSYTRDDGEDVGRLRLARWRMENGLHRDNATMYRIDCPCIESRRATSRAAKDLLNADFRRRKKLERMEDDIRRKSVLRLLPPELRPYFSPSLDD